ncbi:7 transmembrane sweet-taste receptor of 3 GCPR-domain-containing protein [Fimicolochytrium jonesii]|uniref:7 transmembrane sweet-taste receptor of 3 GCPR-domain-containing protein n=1 Tax=Fimicolochytrium jonesii TaxID=1396493 RepID=UPI0022FE0320|nr:7 transmembrane sweet-taste receptor of 3 GCPR-domain-containing protein [Fimicolochytrium jonesii]KAI8817807.1 7 transmembrane sweet-taste receptor of 3 GCPR-domain-containing protein [Fimicolochytrium jonesii]
MRVSGIPAIWLAILCAAGIAVAQSIQQTPTTARLFKSSADLRITVVGHGYNSGKYTDFWPTLWRGINAASNLLGVTIWAPLYDTASTTGTGYGIQEWAEAVANKTDGLVTTLNDAASQLTPIKSNLLAAPNMPLLLYNSGVNYSSVLNSFAYVGQVDWQAGFMVGKELIKRGGTRLVCVFRTLGRVDFQDRCAGAVAAFNLAFGRNDVYSSATSNQFNYLMGTTENIPILNLMDTFQSYLTSNPTIDTILSTQQQVVRAAVGAAGNTTAIAPSRKFVQGVVDYNADVAPLVDVAAHQQTWLQGFVPSIYMYLKLMVNETISGPVVSSGPLLITSDTKAAGQAAVDLEKLDVVPSNSTSVVYFNHFFGLDVLGQQGLGVQDAMKMWSMTFQNKYISTPYSLADWKTKLDSQLAPCASAGATGCPAGILTTDPGDDWLNYATMRAALYNISVAIIGTRGASANTRLNALYVGSDDYQIGWDAAQAMLSRGVTKPICMTIDDLTTATTQARCQGMAAAFTASGAAGITVASSYIRVDAYNTPTGVLVIQGVFKQSGGAPDGYFCTNELICTALVQALPGSGVSPKAVISAGISKEVAVAMGQGVVTEYVDVSPYAAGFLAITNLGMKIKLNAGLIGNSVTVGGSVRNWVCPPGYSINSASTAKPYKPTASGLTGYGDFCVPCTSGTYTAAANALACGTCPFGTFTTKTGTTKCATCVQGDNGADQAVCQAYFLSLEQKPQGTAGLAALAAVSMLGEIGFGVALMALQRFPIIRAATPALSILITVGANLGCLSVIVLQFGLSKATCSAHLWLLCTGFSLIVTPAVVKNYRLYKIFFNPKLRGNALSMGTMLTYVGGVVVGEWILLALWMGIDAPSPKKLQDSTGAFSVCSSQKISVQTGFSIALIMYNALLLIAAVIVATLTKNIKDKQFSESFYVIFSSAGMFFCGIIAIAAGFMPNIDLIARWSIVHLCIIVGSLITPAILFGSRIKSAIFEKVSEDNAGIDVKKPLIFAKGKTNSVHVGVAAAMLEGNVLTRWVGVTASLLMPSPIPGVVFLIISKDPEHPEKGDYYLLGRDGYMLDPKAEDAENLVLVKGKAEKTRLVLQLPGEGQLPAWCEAISRATGGGATNNPTLSGSGGTANVVNGVVGKSTVGRTKREHSIRETTNLDGDEQV